MGGWITPSVCDYQQDAQQQRLNIHSLSKIRGVKSLQAALIISHFTSRPPVYLVSVIRQPGGDGSLSFSDDGRLKNFHPSVNIPEPMWSEGIHPQMRTVCFNEALHWCHPDAPLDLCSWKIDDRANLGEWGSLVLKEFRKITVSYTTTVELFSLHWLWTVRFVSSNSLKSHFFQPKKQNRKIHQNQCCLLCSDSN